MASGWLKLHRELMEKPIWFQSTLEQKVLLITFLMMASHEEKDYWFNGQKIHLMPGQFGTSLEKIVEKTNKQVTVQNVRTALVKFEKLGFLTNVSTKGGRVVTIVNWGLYQGIDSGDNKAPNKELTNDQQRANKRPTNDLTPIKKKEVKKERIKDNNKQDNADADIIKFVEQELAITLSGVAMDAINGWLEDWPDREVIKLAVSESVRQNKRSIAYVSAVLGNWRKRQLKTAAEVEAAISEFEAQKASRKQSGGICSKGAKSPDNFASKPRDLSFLEE